MFDKIVKERRSIRKYQDKPVPRDLINQCLEAARLAPSACNSQPWHFVVFDDKEAKDNFTKQAFTGIYANMKPLADGAAAIIAVVGTVGGNITSRMGQMISGTKFYLIDQGIAVEHLVLKAQDLGLGTCWVGWFDSKKAKKALKLPLDRRVEILIMVGYPDESPSPRPRKEFDEIVSYNKYK